MTKLKIYIDFEAISAPFNRELKLPREFPYAYSLGAFIGNKFKTKTFIFNFSTEDVSAIDDILRVNILRNVREITGNKKFNINRLSTQFISYAPSLEKRILDKVYRGVSLEDISKGAMISLGQATEKYISKDIYFPYLKKWVKNKIEPSFIEKRGLVHDGALAALAGYLLYSDALKKDGKYYNNDLDVKSLIKELVIYSNDDVVRMKYIEADRKGFTELAKSRKSNIIKRNKLSSQVTEFSKINAFLITQKQEQKVENVVKNLKKEIKKMEKKMNDLDI